MTKYAEEYEKQAQTIRENAEIEALEIESKICTVCEGEGFVYRNSSITSPKDYQDEIRCEECRGTGVVG